MSDAEDNREQLLKLLEEIQDDNHIDRHEYIEPVPKQFAHLPRDVRVFLLTLRDDDIDDLKQSIELVRTLRRVGKTTRYIMLAIPIIATTVVTFIDNIHHIIGWFKEALK